MNISDLDYYVKFIFVLDGKQLDFVTSDIKVLKEVVQDTEFKIGQKISFNGESYTIKDIYIKHVKDTLRVNNIGWNSEESPMQGDKKPSLITVCITVS